MKSPELYGWTETCSPIHHLTKSFHFLTQDGLSGFLIGLLNIQHEPGDPFLEVTDRHRELTIIVSLELCGFNANNHCIRNIITQVEHLFASIKYE